MTAANVTFYALAAAVQIALAIYIMARRPRSEWVWVVAYLFLVNGFDAAGFALYLHDQESWIGGLGRYVLHTHADFTSLLLIGHLALVYPRRPAFARRRPWLLPTCSIVVFLVMSTLLSVFGDEFQSGRTFWVPLTWPSLALGYAFPAAVWTLLLVRWTAAWRRQESVTAVEQFKFVLAAFLARAANILPTTFEVSGGANRPPEMVHAAHALNAVPLLALFGCLAVLVAMQARQFGTARRQTWFVLGFAGFGFLEAFLTMRDWGIGYFDNTLRHADVFVLRPVLVWFALARHTSFEVKGFSPWIGRSLLSALTVAFMVGTLGDRFFINIDRPFEVALSTALVGFVTTAIVLAATPWLSSPKGEERDPDAHLEAYAVCLEEAHRNGPPNAAAHRRLEETRVRLGVSFEQAEAIRVHVRMRGQPAPAEWLPGTLLLGRYRIVSLLGAGSSGEAYLVEDCVARRNVVLKRTCRLDPPARRALLHEASIMQRMTEAPVVPLLGIETVGQEPVLVLEHQEGGSLAGLLERSRRLPPVRAVAIALDVLVALEAAHAAGIVHSDVKPSNILLDGVGRAKLADFGVSTAPSPAHRLGDTTLAPTENPGTRAGGTLRYMAPEQVLGRTVDARTDLYAMAAVLHEMLGGMPVVAMDRGDFESRRAIVDEGAPLLPPGVPAPLRQAVRRGLAKNPDGRFRTAAAFAQALRAAIRDGRPTPSARPRPRPRSTGGGARPSPAGGR